MAGSATFNPPRFSAMRVRILSAVAIAALLAGTFGPLLLPVDGSGGLMTITRVLGWALATAVAIGSPGWRYVAPGELDERERSERATAVVIGHRITGICIALAFVWALGGQVGRLWLPGPAEVGWLIGALFSLHIMVPAAVLAWRDLGEEE